MPTDDRMPADMSKLPPLTGLVCVRCDHALAMHESVTARTNSGEQYKGRRCGVVGCVICTPAPPNVT